MLARFCQTKPDLLPTMCGVTHLRIAHGCAKTLAMKGFAHSGWWTGYYDAKLLETFADEAEWRITEFSQQNLANLAWAYGKLGHYHKGLLDAIAKQAASMLEVSSFACPFSEF